MTHYSTVAAADSFFLTEYLDEGDLWKNASESQKIAAMTMATVAIDLLNFTGDKNDANQSFEFPRGEDTVVPEAINKATYLIAYNLLDGRDPELEAEFLNEEIIASSGPARLRKSLSFVPYSRLHGIVSESAWRLLKPYLRNGESLTLSRVS